METPSTIIVEQDSSSQIIYMTWQSSVNDREVRAAFENISNLLNMSTEPQRVVVDIRANPNFPLSATINGALFGPFRNPMLQEWLIIGVNPLARVIERSLKAVTGRSNIVWFSTEEEIADYLDRQAA